MDTQTWRLIPLLEASGEVQMTIDRWLLEQHISGKHPPTLRFYTWSSPTISLGYHQKKYPQHWQNLTWEGKKLDLVRRPTGGRAVLHQGDLTYAVIVSGLPSSRIEAYKKICEFLIQGWRNLGVDLHYGSAGRSYIHNPNCFGTATSADLVLPDNTKFIGSAQLRKGNVILQHGSIRLQPNPELFARVFGAESFTPVKLPDHLEINKINPEQINLEKIIDILVDAAINCFGINLIVNPLSQLEWQNILSN